MNILFLTHDYPNYVPDLLLHGLRKLLGPGVVDFPRKDSLYRGDLFGVTSDQYACPELLPTDEDVDREDIPQKIRNNYFKYIICDVRLTLKDVGFTDQGIGLVRYGGIRLIPLFRDEQQELPPGIVLIDGEDYPLLIPPGQYAVCRRETDGTDYSIPLPIALPEEIMRWITSHDDEEKLYSVGFLGAVDNTTPERRGLIEKIIDRYPDSLLQTSNVPSPDNPCPAGRVGRNDYYIALQRCKVVLNLKGAGYDTFRYWENAACKAVHISQRMPLFIPHDFVEGQSILRFSSVEELMMLIDMVLEGKIQEERMIQESRHHLFNFHLTTRRAMYLLDRLRKVFVKRAVV